MTLFYTFNHNFLYTDCLGPSACEFSFQTVSDQGIELRLGATVRIY